MEDIKTQIKKIEKESFYQKTVLSMLNRFEKGELWLTLPNGETRTIGKGEGYKADLVIVDDRFFKQVLMYGDIGFGESYCDGHWETSDLTMLMRWAISNIENSPVMSGSSVKSIGVNILGAFNRLAHLSNKNSKKGSQSNISYHYDLSNDFYSLMLDETMSYSCAIFENESMGLHEAQLAKLESICSDLDLRQDDHVLEIGCGWGGLAIHAVQKTGCRWTGITISREQYNYACEKVKTLGLEDKITILLQDYRDLEGKFSKIVSIEMIEAVGHEYLPQYFQNIDRLLDEDGVAVIQAITSPDSRYDEFRKGVDFIQKHIFPGSLLPSVGAMVSACQTRTKLHLCNLRDIGLSYAKTLRKWDQAVEEKKSEMRKLGMDDAFFRKWKYYLNYCEAAFQERNISTVQITLTRPNNISYKM